jgi:LmbE family N-acetylglucosaminyl deacetylase
MSQTYLKRTNVSLLVVLAAFLGVTSAAYAQESNSDVKPLRIIVFGAHPDDCELKAGGVAAKWAALGHKVKFVSVTNGDVGHNVIAGGPLAQRRTSEVQAAAKILGIETQVLDHHDGELMPTVEIRKQLIRLTREWQADLVISPRPNDYHPDHRYTAILVQDGAYMVTVPYICPDVPVLRKNPVYMYMWDGFQKPNPFQADVVVSIDDVIEKKLDALAAITSQFAEWGPWHDGNLEQVPKGQEAAKTWIKDGFRTRYQRLAPLYREQLTKWYGTDKGAAVKFVEAFEICEYGTKPSEDDLRRLFPFFGE